MCRKPATFPSGLVDVSDRACVGRCLRHGAIASVSFSGAEYARDEYVLPWTDDSVYDVVRDTAADLDVSIRSLRGRARSLEDIYFGNIATNGSHPSTQGDD